MKFHFLFSLLFASAIVYSQQSQTYLYDPSISPNGTEIAFVSGGDIWTVASSGGEARLLVSHTANEMRPLYSPDGKYLAFISTRTGNGDIYILEMQTGALTRLTFDDGGDDLHAWSADGKYIYFSTNSQDISGMRDVLRIKATGGTAMPVSDHRYMNEFYAAPSPDGKTLAFAARGFGVFQWWRLGRSHLDESEIWLLNEADKKYTKLAEKGAKQLWPMWSADGKTLYYVSDRNGPQNLWAHPVNGTAKPLTSFKNSRVLWPSISKNGETIVFERDFKIWKYDFAKGEAKPLSINLRGASASPATELLRLSNGFSNLALAPDGKKIAFTARGEVFVAGTKEGGEATRITNTPEMEGLISWLPGSNSIVYLSKRSGKNNIYQYDFLTAKETALTASNNNDGGITLSGDGKKIAFIRNNAELRVLDLSTKKETLLTKGNFNFSPIASGGNISWSPDGKWIAYAAYGAKALRNIYIVPSVGGEAKPVSFLANTFGSDVVWTADGKSVLFTTGQRTENGNIARVDLQPRQPRFREDQFRDLFSDPNTSKPATKSDPVVDSLAGKKGKTDNQPIVWEGIRQRLSLLPLNADVNSMTISKDGNTLFILANIGGQFNIFSYSLDELSKEPAVLKQLTTTPGFKSDLQVSADGKEVYYVESGRLNSVSVDSRAVKPIAVTAEMQVDFNKEKLEVFHQAWELQNKGFYDEGFHGVDWNAVKRNYEPLAAGAKTPDELRRILNLMVGELNASHSGVGFSGGSAPATGRTGLRFNANLYEKEARLRITDIVDYSPAALAGNIRAGDYLTAIDGITINASHNLDQLLENKINRRVVLSVANADGKDLREVVIKPVSVGVEKGLLYKQWVQNNREHVAKISGGKLGYVHMFDMGEESLRQFYLDLDAENHLREGVVVDIRNNNGGFVNAYALDVLSRRGYMNMQPRGLPTAPARVQLGQRALDAPTILITNQHSLSDAEDFSEGYRVLGLGKIVGEPTASWIIYTSNITLFDGTSVRLPFIKVTDNQGRDMELSPRPVDIPISNNLGDKGDSQLDLAVKELLKQLK